MCRVGLRTIKMINCVCFIFTFYQTTRAEGEQGETGEPGETGEQGETEEL